MHDLLSLQKKLQAYLLHAERAIDHDIVETKKVSAQTRLAIYSNAYS